MIYDFQKEIVLISKEIAQTNKLRAEETQSLIRHLEKSTTEIINQCKENMKEINKSSDRLISLLEKLEQSKE